MLVAGVILVNSPTAELILMSMIEIRLTVCPWTVELRTVDWFGSTPQYHVTLRFGSREMLIGICFKERLDQVAADAR